MEKMKLEPESQADLDIGHDDIYKGQVSKEQLKIATKKHYALAKLGKEVSVRDVLIRDKFYGKTDVGNEPEKLNQRRYYGSDSLILPLFLCDFFSIFPVECDSVFLKIYAARRLEPHEKRVILHSCEFKTSYLQIIPASFDFVKSKNDQLKKEAALFPSIIDKLSIGEIKAQDLSSALYSLFMEALKKGASDIHLDRKRDPDSWVSFRIDGVLLQEYLIGYHVMSAIFARIKIDAGLDASNNRDAQDGRLSFEYGGRLIDLRVSSQPLADGETIAIRILDPNSLPSFDSLFPADYDLRTFVKKITSVRVKTGSLVLISGPTGAGKTTSLYSIAQNIPRDAMNVVTVEDPVEYTLPFARQIQVNQLTNQKTSATERSLLRQDPDVIIMGEIRDYDSALAALKFMESGHMVMATIHASNILQTLERFISFFDISTKTDALITICSTLKLLFNQRLIPKLCMCARFVEDSDIDIFSQINSTFGVDWSRRPFLPLKIKTGCNLCGFKGYRGRVLACESLVIDISEGTRSHLAKKVINSDLGLIEIFKSTEGVLMKERKGALISLLESGIIDYQTAYNVFTTL